MSVSVIAITRNGAQLGAKLSGGLADCRLHVLRKYHGTAGKKSIPFDELKELLSSLWAEGDALVCIMATGIVVRIIAPLLNSKQTDPPVVVIDDTGKFSISLLSGHLGGANELAERAAWLLGARAVITTATDANSLPSFDMLAKEHGWKIENLGGVRLLNSMLLDGLPIAVVDSTDMVRPWFHGKGNLLFFDTFAEALESPARGHLFVTNRHLPPQVSPKSLLVLRPPNLILGIGCNSGTPVDEIETFVLSQLKRIFLSPLSVCTVATATAKREESGILEFASLLGAETRFFSSEELNSVKPPSGVSEHAIAAIGAQGVAEPAAMLASGNSRLLLKKVRSENVTLAIAEAKA